MALVRARRPYDWSRDCPAAFSRQFPAIVGRGRGCTLQEAQRRADRAHTFDCFNVSGLPGCKAFPPSEGGFWQASREALALVEPDEAGFYPSDFVKRLMRDYGLEVFSSFRHDPDRPGSLHSPQPGHLDREAHNRLH